MAGVRHFLWDTGKTIYGHIRSSVDGSIYSGTALGNYTTTAWGGYKNVLTEDASSGFYKFSFPALSASIYYISYYIQAGASATTTDAPPIGGDVVDWDGSNISLVSTRSIHTATDVASAIHNATITSTSFAADTHGERITAIDNKLPAGTISDFTATTAVTATAVVVATMTSTTVVGTVNNLGASATAQINAEVLDVLATDTITEQSVGAPPATPTHREAVSYLYMAWRNQVVTTANKTSISNDAGATIASATISFATATTTFTKQEFS